MRLLISIQCNSIKNTIKKEYYLLVFTVFKILGRLVKLIRPGYGSTLPGYLLNLVYPQTFKHLVDKLNNFILVSGTNGKTTTVGLTSYVLNKLGYPFFTNSSGANITSGLLTCLLSNKKAFSLNFSQSAILEVDENHLSLFLDHPPSVLVLLNLFRDQMDRYTELDKIVKSWRAIFLNWSSATTLVLNADDPYIASLGYNYPGKIIYFGVNSKFGTSNSKDMLVDICACPICGGDLIYTSYFYSHLGIWKCKSCDFARPKPRVEVLAYEKLSPCIKGVKVSFLNKEIFIKNLSLAGFHNLYNLAASLGAAAGYGVDLGNMPIESWLSYKPSFARQEQLEYQGTVFSLVLSKNPVGFNQNLNWLKENLHFREGGKRSAVVFGLNDLFADGRDISWIWDVDFEAFSTDCFDTYVYGSRYLELHSRLSYAHLNVTGSVFDFKQLLPSLRKYDCIYLLCSYTAMLAARRTLLSNRKI